MDVHATVLWRTEMDWASQAGVGGRVQMPRMSALLTTDRRTETCMDWRGE